MNLDHDFWAYKRVANGAILGPLQGYDDDWKLYVGMDLSGEFPSDAYVEMNPDFPDNTLLTDHMRNRGALILISGRLKELVQAAGVPDLQFLPVGVKDHKRRLAATYFIVNPTKPVACFDMAAGKPTFDALVDDQVARMEAFVPDPSACANLPAVFRPEGITHILISRDLAKQIDDAGMTGNGWVDPNRLAGKDIPVDLRGMTLD